jgi:hypothetical protein
MAGVTPRWPVRRRWRKAGGGRKSTALSDQARSADGTRSAADPQQVDVQAPGQTGALRLTASTEHLHRSLIRARETRDRSCPAAPAGPGRHPGHPVAVEGLPVSGPGPMTHASRNPARWALTIVTVHNSVVALRNAVKKASRRSHRAVVPAREAAVRGGISGVAIVFLARRGRGAARPERVEVTSMQPVSSRCVVVDLAPRGCVHLYSRPHIDLLRVAGALCCS